MSFLSKTLSLSQGGAQGAQSALSEIGPDVFFYSKTVSFFAAGAWGALSRSDPDVFSTWVMKSGPKTGHMYGLEKKMHPMHPGSNKEVILFAGFHDLGGCVMQKGC